MCDIRPFAGVHYNSAGADIGSKLAPPYDVLSEDDKQRLLARDPNNFVKIDLPFTPPKQAGPPEAYAGAKRILDQWLAEGVLVRDEQPALYVYHQSFTHAGRHYVRKMFFARLALEEFGQGSVYAHEQTFGGPKEDRLLLTKATASNLSPIFGLYEDRDNAVAQRLEGGLGPRPLLSGELDDTQNEVWAVSDPSVQTSVANMMASKAVYIADGHHRYGTSLLYRAWLQEQRGAPLPSEYAANFVLCVFCAMEDAGLLILPTHRVLPGLAVPVSLIESDPNLEVIALETADAAAALAKLPNYGAQAVALRAADGRLYAVRPRNADLLDELEPGHSPAWRRLALAFLHAYLLDRVITPQLRNGQPPEIHYVKNAGEAVQEAASTNGSVFLMQPSTMDELRAVCNAGDLMPQKSTFFYPKLASGLLVNSLE